MLNIPSVRNLPTGPSGHILLRSGSRAFLKEKSQLHKIPPFPSPFLFFIFLSFSLTPSFCLLLLSSPTFRFRFLFLSLSHIPLRPFSFSLPFPSLSSPQNSARRSEGALLASPAGSGAQHRIAANRNCTNVRLERHRLMEL